MPLPRRTHVQVWWNKFMIKHAWHEPSYRTWRVFPLKLLELSVIFRLYKPTGFRGYKRKYQGSNLDYIELVYKLLAGEFTSC